jgi:hypothetical protein
VRSIFERFSDLNALSLATADYVIAKGQAEAVPRDVDGTRSIRIRSHVETRALACEKWLPLWRIIAGLDQPELRMRVQFARLANVERIKLMYRFELSLLAEPDELLIALATLISFESWDQMRHSFGLSTENAQAVWRSTIDRMLPSAE